jgi:membrane protease YdiL (CAAX protease family)
MFKISEDYIKITKSYDKKDALYAVLAFLLCFVVVNLAAIYPALVYVRGVEPENIFLFNFLINALITLVIVGFIFALMVIRKQKQKMLSHGLVKKNTLKSLLLAVIICLIITLLDRRRIFNGEFIIASALIVPRIFSLLTTAFGEELVFRAYIGPRLYGFFQNKALSVFVTGLMFGVLHFAGLVTVITIGFHPPGVRLSTVFISTFAYALIHCIYHWIYAKYNNIWGPTLLHAYSNFVALSFVIT